MATIHHATLMQRADDVPGPPQGQWTYEAYAAIPENGKRYEVVRGVLYMAPAPGMKHQSIAGHIFYHLTTHVYYRKLGKTFFAPFDVQLNEKTIVQPDVLVILNAHRERITESRIIGAPDLVVEILSPKTASKDRHEKRAAYEQAGVPEYWLVDPETRSVELLVLKEGRYQNLGAFRGKERVPSRIVPELPVEVEQFFADLAEEEERTR